MHVEENASYFIDTDPLTMRIYTKKENVRLDASCRGFLLFLEQIQVLNLETREMVIDRVMALDNTEFDLEDLKWVVLMVLFNIPGMKMPISKWKNCCLK